MRSFFWKAPPLLADNLESMDTSYNRIAGQDLGRMAALSDGVFAVDINIHCLAADPETHQGLSVAANIQVVFATVVYRVGQDQPRL